MVSLFDILPLYVATACVTIVWLMRLFDGTIWRWGVIAAAGIAGWFICVFLLNCIKKLINARTRKKLKALSLDELDKRLKDSKCVELNFVLLEIKERGENITQYWPYLLDLLEHDQCPRRFFASKAVYAAFPDEFKRLCSQKYTPYETVDKCRMKLESLKKELDIQPTVPPLA